MSNSRAIAAGWTWLTQQSPIAEGAASERATPLQAGYEQLITQLYLDAQHANATLASPLASAVLAHTDTDTDTESLARRTLLTAKAGQNTASLLSSLLANQDSSGGFGPDSRYLPNIVDTAWAVLALSEAGAGQGTAATRARAWLLSQWPDPLTSQLTDPGQQQWVFHQTALLLSALGTDSSLNTSAPLATLLATLLAAQGSDGAWSADVATTARVWLAIGPATPNTTVKNAVQTYLINQQQANGSWQDDVYLTALALRALQDITGQQGATVAGTVLDQATQLPLPGVTVHLQTATSSSSRDLSTDATGAFSVSDLAAGDYTLVASLTGYQSSTVNFTLASGQQINLGHLLLSPVGDTGTVLGTATDASSGTPLAGVLITLVDAPNRTATTGTDGSYRFTAVPAGTLTLLATRSGYQTQQSTGILAAGGTVLFSPALTPTGQSVPSRGSFTGRVTDAATGLPLAGVKVGLDSGALITTGGDGRYQFSLAPGQYGVSYKLSGYKSRSLSFLLTAGSTYNTGDIALGRAVSQTSLSGHVRNTQGSALAGASVSVNGGTPVTTGADGTFHFSALSGDRFTLQASASGYSGQAITLFVSEPDDLVQDLTLVATQTGNLSIGPLVLSPNSVPSNTLVTINASVSNPNDTDVSATLQLLVQDSNGKTLGKGLVVDGQGNPLGIQGFAPHLATPITAQWNSGQYPPGRYTLTLVASAAGTINRANPLGQILAEGQGNAQVVADRRIGGGIDANPPVLRLGSSTPVQLTASVVNTGNAEITPQGYRLTITDSNQQQVYSQSVGAGAIAVAGLAAVNFPVWTPAVAGQYQAQLVPDDVSQGSLSRSLYVGAAPSATFTLDRNVVPVGAQAVHARLQITGTDPLSGAVQDPLADLIKTAVRKAVFYNDQQTSSWTVSNKCEGCHVQTQALVAGESSARIVPDYNQRQRSLILDNITQSQIASGAFRYMNDSSGTDDLPLTTLSLWSLNTAQRKAELAMTLYRGANYLIQQQDSTGVWKTTGPGWMESWLSSTVTNLRSLVDIRSLISGLTTPLKDYRVEPWLTNTTYKQMGFISDDGEGGLYVSYFQGPLVHYDAQGQTLTSWDIGAQGTTPIPGVPGGTLAATEIGVYKLFADGHTQKFNGSPGMGQLIYGPNNRIYGSMSYYGYERNIAIIDASSGQIVSGYQSPYIGTRLHGLMNDYDGNLLVASEGYDSYALIYASDIYSVNKNGFFSSLFSYHGYHPPYDIKPRNGGYATITKEGVYGYNSHMEGQRLTFTGGSSLAVTPGGEIRFTDAMANTIYRVVETPVDTGDALSAYHQSIQSAIQWLLANPQNNSTNTLAVAQEMYGLDAARRYLGASDPDTVAAITAQMKRLDTLLRARQNADGGWGHYVGNRSDSMVTAQVGLSLDTLNPSTADPVLRRAIIWLLSVQNADGSWSSQNGLLTTNPSATSWVTVWLPVILDRLGGIDTGLTLDFPANIALTNAATAPDTQTQLGSGGTRYHWQFNSAKNQGVDLGLDLLLSDLNYNEQRPAATAAYLSFTNSFTQGEDQIAIDIPQVTAAAGVSLGVVTDQSRYGAQETVTGTLTLVNNNDRAAAGSLTVRLLNSHNEVLATYPLGKQNLAARRSSTRSVQWNTGSALAGAYHLDAVLEDSVVNSDGTGSSVTLASARADFDVVASGNGLTATLATDKRRYRPTDNVLIQGKVFNLDANRVSDTLTLVEEVLNAQGQVLAQQQSPLGQLVNNGNISRQFTHALNQADPGTYGVRQRVLDSQGRVVDERLTLFQVQTTQQSGDGLGGAILAQPGSVYLGGSLTLTSQVYNQGNADLPGLPLTIYVVDPDAGTVLAQYPLTGNLTQGSTLTLPDQSWTATGRVGAQYLAVLTATVEGAQLTLAQTSFQVLAPVVAGITATAGTPQGTPAGTAYPIALQATVRDNLGAPMAGVPVTFSAPDSGPSVSFPQGNTATTNAQGQATVGVSANNQTGRFTVSASAPDLSTPASFQLTNQAAVAARLEMVSGSPQRGALNHRFGLPLAARVLDSTGQAMAGVVVSFTAGATPPVSFPNGDHAITNSQGIASIIARGGPQAGTTTVTASAPQAQGQAVYLLTLDNACGSPEPIHFTPLVQQPVATLVLSEPVVISGVGSGCSAALVVNGGAYRLVRQGVVITRTLARSPNLPGSLGRAAPLVAEFSSEPTAIQDGDQITLAQVTANEFQATTQIQASFGDVVAAWPVTTLDLNLNPAVAQEIPVLSPLGKLLLSLALVLALLLVRGSVWGRTRRQGSPGGPRC